MIIAISTWSIVFSGIVLCVFLTILYSNRLVKERRKQHKDTHPPMSDIDFLAKLNIDVRNHDICVNIRRAVAQVIQVPAETLYPSMSDVDLAKLGLTFEELMLALGEIGPYEIDFVVAHKLAYDDKNRGLAFYGDSLSDLVYFILDHLEILKVR